MVTPAGADMTGLTLETVQRIAAQMPLGVFNRKVKWRRSRATHGAYVAYLDGYKIGTVWRDRDGDWTGAATPPGNSFDACDDHHHWGVSRSLALRASLRVQASQPQRKEAR